MATERIKIEDLERFDPVDHLRCEESIQAYLADAEQEPDPRWLPIALAHVERARKRWDLRASAPDSGLSKPS